MQKLMNTANHKPVSESARLSDEKTYKYKTIVGMKLSSDNLIILFICSLNVSGDIIRCSGKFYMVDTASVVLNNSKSKDERKMRH